MEKTAPLFFALIWKSAVVFRAERGGKPHEIYRAGMGFEMNNLLTVRIQDKMTSFSKGQRLIAKYILEHYDKLAFMTAARLGATVGVSESTVVRFATEIGYTGYPELQQAMQ